MLSHHILLPGKDCDEGRQACMFLFMGEETQSPALGDVDLSAQEYYKQLLLSLTV